jgi:hypothetical protein
LTHFIGTGHVSAKPPVAKGLNIQFDRNLQYDKIPLLNLSLQHLAANLPFDIDKFLQVQENAFLSNKQSMQIGWREYIIGEVQEAIRPMFKSFITEPKQYFGTEFERIVKRVDLIATEHIRSSVCRRFFTRWDDFLKGFTQPRNINIVHAVRI